MTRRVFFALLSALTLGAALPANADPLNVLWYEGGAATSSFFSRSGGSGTSDYQQAVQSLATANGWNVTFWNSGTMSTAGFNVLVVASNDGNWGTAPDYSALDAALTAPGGLSFDPTSQRVEVTGADADWHLTSDLNPISPINVTNVNTFLANSVDWAGGGSGLGLVALGMSGLGNPTPTSNPPVFGFTGYSASSASSNSIGALSSPINTGLTSSSLSGWNFSSHYDFAITDTTTWTGVDTDTDPNNPSGQFTTIVSNPLSGTSGPNVPEPSSLISLVGIGLASLIAVRRRKTA